MNFSSSPSEVCCCLPAEDLEDDFVADAERLFVELERDVVLFLDLVCGIAMILDFNLVKIICHLFTVAITQPCRANSSRIP